MRPHYSISESKAVLRGGGESTNVKCNYKAYFLQSSVFQHSQFLRIGHRVCAIFNNFKQVMIYVSPSSNIICCFIQVVFEIWL